MEKIKTFTSASDFAENFESVVKSSKEPVSLSLNPKTLELYEAAEDDIYHIISISEDDIRYNFDISSKIASAKALTYMSINSMKYEQ